MVPAGHHNITSFSSSRDKVIIKNREFEVEGPKKAKLALRFMPIPEPMSEKYDIFVLKDHVPW